MFIFVTGSDTDVGKSYVCRGICKEMANHNETVGYLKPFQSGVVEGILNDADSVQLGGENIITKSSYITRTPSTPLISAEIDNVEFDLNKIVSDYELMKKQCQNVIVEGSGGIYVPVKKGVLMIDVIKKLYEFKNEKVNMKEYFFLCEYIEGEFGTGDGEEFSNNPEYKDSGEYIPEIIKREKIEDIVLLPLEIKEKFVQDLKAGKL